jgi:hypothetical protein
MKPRSLSFLCLALFAALSPRAAFASEASIIVRRDLATARPAEMIAVPLSALKNKLSDAAPEKLAVRREGEADTLPTQILAEPASRVPGGELLFLADLGAGERETRFSVTVEAAPGLAISPRVFGRAVPERFDDFAFENDRVAHRVYGPALSAPSAGREQLVSSGVDVWCKRTRALVVDKWYSSGKYHADHGEGLDFYHVGRTRGCGGSGFWDGTSLHPSGNWVGNRILAAGPIRLVFELDYAEWDTGQGARVAETKRFTVDAGQNLHRVDSMLFGDAPGQGYALGLAKHPPTPAAVESDLAAGWMTKWESYAKPEQGGLGTAVLFAGISATAAVEDDKNHLLVAVRRGGEGLTYYFGAGWARSGDFSDEASWRAYVAGFAERLRHPISVSVD